MPIKVNDPRSEHNNQQNPYALETANQWLKHFVCLMSNMDVWNGLRWISAPHHDAMASFSLYKWPWIPKSGADLASVMA